MICSSETVWETSTSSLLQDNNVLLESIINNIFVDDVDLLEQNDGMVGSITDGKDGMEME